MFHGGGIVLLFRCSISSFSIRLLWTQFSFVSYENGAKIPMSESTHGAVPTGIWREVGPAAPHHASLWFAPLHGANASAALVGGKREVGPAAPCRMSPTDGANVM
jgi:hypothetical protein